MQSKIHIRRANTWDYDIFCELMAQIDSYHREAHPAFFREAHPSRDYSFFHAWIQSPSRLCLLAEWEGQAVGCIMAEIRETPDIPIIQPRRYVLVDTLVVAEGYRGQGIGRALMSSAHEWAGKQNIAEMQLGVWAFNTPAIRMYETLGYTIMQHRMVTHIKSPGFIPTDADVEVSPLLEIHPIHSQDRPWVSQFIQQQWGAEIVVSRGRIHRPAELPGFIARWDSQLAGVVTYHLENQQCEVVSLDSLMERRGIGTALMNAVKSAAQAEGCQRLWLITTNDNLNALRFYQKWGLVLVAVHPNALEQSRQLKPEIPLIGLDGIPLRDEIELELVFA